MSSSTDTPSSDTPSADTIDLWAYMPCKNAHGSRARRYITARDEIVWKFFDLHEEEPTLKSDDTGILLPVKIRANIPKTGWKDAVKESAYKHVDGVVQKELNQKDGVAKWLKKELEKQSKKE
ncbi:uncharacterized protein LDX57_000311 [Aspergillus melleus]|uniref:uncharacterized protein n=1 Tax=Aspergillus melleus TaxID=138277 RepID=UPI001E8D5F6D|nr:uncharacterized protein LDX57_000311 [Aspergillus melleus]KAH8422558.1 hypothetical protein LDX57_000311 [Aspergillus melleus]